MVRTTKLLLFSLAISSLWAQPNVIDRLAFEPVMTDLQFPVAVTHAGDGSERLFVSTLGGEIWVWNTETQTQQLFLDLGGLPQCCDGMSGFYSATFHPDFESNGRFFVVYAIPVEGQLTTTVSEFQVSGEDPTRADRSSERIIMRIEQPQFSHNGGDLEFGPDGYLYIGLGDGGTEGSGTSAIGDPENRAQDMSQLFGKMLRIDVDSGDPYGIPPTNPFLDQEGVRPEIWSSGIRSPWRFSFDRETGDMFLGDVGHNLWEEINFQPSTSSGGENYGWSLMEGPDCFRPTQDCNDGSLVLPIIEYPHEGDGCSGSVTGGFRYRGAGIPELRGAYVFGDFCDNLLFVATESNNEWTALSRRFRGVTFVSFGEDEQGEIYAASFARTGAVHRIVLGNPIPAISSLTPSSAIARGAAFRMTINGSSFFPGSVVLWNESERPTTYIDPNRLQVEIPASDLARPNRFRISVRNPEPGGGTGDFTIFEVETSNRQPRINSGGVVSAASFAGGVPLAPGMIASVFGPALAVRLEEAGSTPLPTLLGGTTMSFNETIAAPVFFASPLQSNIQVPWELAGLQEATLTARISDDISEPVQVALALYSPGLLTVTQTGVGQAAVLISGTRLLAAASGAFPGAPSRPAVKGEFLEMFATGLGPVSHTPTSGTAASANPVSETLTMPTVLIGDAQARVAFAGLAPGFVGLYQVNAQVPASSPSGENVPLAISIGGADSLVVTIAVE